MLWTEGVVGGENASFLAALHRIRYHKDLIRENIGHRRKKKFLYLKHCAVKLAVVDESGSF